MLPSTLYRALTRHTRLLLHPVRPPILLRPLSRCQFSSSSPFSDPAPPRPSSPFSDFQLPLGLPKQLYAVPRHAFGLETPLELAHPHRANGNMDVDLPVPKVQMEMGKAGRLPVTSMSDPSKVYMCERFDDYSYSCNCPAWAFMRGKAIDDRTCKHLRELLGDEFENARVGASVNSGKNRSNTPATGGSKAKGKGKGKAASESKGARGMSTSAAASSSSAAAASTDEAPQYAAPGAKKRAIVPLGKKGKGKGKGKAKKAKLAQVSEEEETEEEVGPVKMEAETGYEPGEEVSEVEEDRPTKGKGQANEKKGGAELLLAQKFNLDGKKDPKGYWISEKLDGIRAYWDGQSTIWSRLGNPFAAPPDFIAQLPRGTTLDGELFIGRNRFDETSGIVRSLSSGRWGELKYMVFDIPSMGDSLFEDRLAKLHEMFPTAPRDVNAAVAVKDEDGGGLIKVVEHELCEGKEHLVRRLEEVQKMGGEGLMLRQPSSRYIPKRSTTLLKVKTFYDAEARVVGYEAGKGKYEGMVGSMECEMENGKKFNCGSGLTDEKRMNAPAIGSIITYRFFELTKAGIPRFPTFVGERIDSAGPKDAALPGKVTKAKKEEDV